MLQLSFSLVSAEGKAKLIDRHTVEVALAGGGTRRLTARHILLAQGGTPVRADVPGKVLAHCADYCNKICLHVMVCFHVALCTFHLFNPSNWIKQQILSNFWPSACDTS